MLAACKSPGVVTSEPAAGAMSGYYEVSFDVSEARIDGEVTSVFVGGIRAYDIRHQGDAVTVIVQGAPASGPADVEMDHAEGTAVFAGAFTYDPPVDPLFDRVMAMGASLTQGTQGGVPTYHANLANPAFQFARQGGAYLPLPLLVPDLFAVIGPEDIGPAPYCTPPDVIDFIAEASVDVVNKLNDVEADRVGFYLGRVDPDLVPQDVAVGGSKVANLVHGAGADFGKQFVTKLVYAPYNDILEDVTVSQLELVEDFGPTLVLSTDAFGNDLIAAIFESLDIDTSKLTPVAELRADLTELVDRLEATGAEVFLANMPRATVLPATADKREAAINRARTFAENAGEDVDLAVAEETAAVDARIAEVEAVGVEYNAILEELAASRPTIHRVDFAGRVEEIERDELIVDGVALSVRKFGGLLSTDGVHFSDTGYALVANLFVETINAELGLNLEAIDLAPVLATDPYSPATLAEGGLVVAECTGT